MNTSREFVWARPPDALTGLPERAHLRDAITAALATRREGETVAVAVLGLDRFSGVNTALGRAAGNDVLLACATRLRSLGGTVARLGGDEFAVLVSGRDVRQIGDTVAETFRHPIETGGRSIFLGASIGVACAPDDSDDADTLLQHADTAMQLAKERGGSLVLPFAGALREEVEERLAIASGLQQAIERNELVVHYQPIVETITKRLVGMEALVRWQHPTLGLIGPDRFIPIAEDTGLIVPLGNWVLREACDHAARWQRFTKLRVAINLSPRQFEHEHIDEVIAEALRISGLDPQLLEVELTERAVLHDDSVVVGMLQRLRDLGVGFAVDDFGTGYGGLSYLIRFPIAQLKIDRSFVKEIESGGDHAVIVAGLIGLARELGMDVVAEGVESQAQADFLERHGCAHFQGFLVSKPLSADCFEALLASVPATTKLPAPTRRRDLSRPGATHPAPVRPGPRRTRRRALPVIAMSASAAVMAMTGSASALPALGQQTIGAVVRQVQAVFPTLDSHEHTPTRSTGTGPTGPVGTAGSTAVPGGDGITSSRNGNDAVTTHRPAPSPASPAAAPTGRRIGAPPTQTLPAPGARAADEHASPPAATPSPAAVSPPSSPPGSPPQSPPAATPPTTTRRTPPSLPAASSAPTAARSAR